MFSEANLIVAQAAELTSAPAAAAPAGQSAVTASGPAPAATGTKTSSPAPAGPANQPSGMDGLMGMLPMFLIFGVMIYLMFRSQRKEAKRREAMISAIKVGDEVITSGGIKGTVTNIKESSYMVKSADSKLEVVKAGVNAVVDKESK